MYFDEFRDFDANWLRKIDLQVAHDKGDEEGNPHKLMVPSKFILAAKAMYVDLQCVNKFYR